MKNFKLHLLVAGLQLFSLVHSRANEPKIVMRHITEPYTLSEGPHWDIDAQVLYYVDIPNQTLYCYDPATKNVTHTYIKNGMLGVAIPVEGQNNKFVAGAGTDFVKVTWDPKTNDTDPKIEVLATVDNDRNGTRFNDGKIDPKGRFWGGTMGILMEPDLGSLYRIDDDFVPKRMVSPVSISNGLVWNHKNDTFYYIDTPTKQIWSYNYDLTTGDISNKKTIFDFTESNVPGKPDGMTIDSTGNLWIASYGGGRVISVNPKTGKLLRTVELPPKQVTSVAFGGPNLDILYVTTARQGLTEEELQSQPNAGCVFSIEGLGVSGRPMLRYRM